MNLSKEIGIKNEIEIDSVLKIQNESEDGSDIIKYKMNRCSINKFDNKKTNWIRVKKMNRI